MIRRSPGALRRSALVALAALLPAAASAEPGHQGNGHDGSLRKTAVFAVELDDPSLPYGRSPPAAVLKRLELVTGELRRQLTEKGGVEPVDLAGQAEEIRKQAPLFKCNGCAGDIAKAAGAELMVTAVAEKGSAQLFNLTITIAEAASGRIVRQGLVVIRANTDDDWMHAVRSIVKNRLLAEPMPNRS